MDILENLAKTIIKLIKDRIHLGSLTTDDIAELVKIERTDLYNLIEVLDQFSTEQINALRDKFKMVTKRPQDKIDNRYLITSLTQTLRGKAQTEERVRCFGSMLKCAKIYYGICDEILKNLHQLFPNKSIAIDSTKISDVMLLGILREMDAFVKYTSFLFEYFTLVITNGENQKLYRQAYLAENTTTVTNLINNILNKTSNYSFIKDIDRIKRSHVDLTLGVTGDSSFLSFLDLNKFTPQDQTHLEFGTFGLSIFGWLTEILEQWKYANHKRAKLRKEWLTEQKARLLLELADASPDSQQARDLQKYIDAYSDAIAQQDKLISAYETTEN